MKKKKILTDKFKTSIDELHQKIQAIQSGIKELKQSGLNENILYYVIQRASQAFNNSYIPINIGTIKAIVSGLEELEKYMFPEMEEKRGDPQ